MTAFPDDLPPFPTPHRTESEIALIASVLTNTFPLHCDVIGPANLMEVSRGGTFEEPVGGHRLDMTAMLANLSSIATIIQFSALAAGWAIAKARKSSGTAAQPAEVLSTAVQQQFANDPRIAAVLRDDPAVIDKIVTDVLTRLTTSQNSSQAT